MQHTTIRPQGAQPLELLPPRFQVTRTDRDGTESWTGSATELETALRRAIRMTGCTVEAHRDGGATIVRTVPKAAWDVDGITLRYKPIIPANLTEQRSADLRIIAREPWVRRDGRGLTTLRYEIPPAATARLFARGLVTEDAVTGDVSVSIVARLALLADEHRTRTTQPRGYHHSTEHIGRDRHGGRVYDGSSWAGCSCKLLSEYTNHRAGAARAARRHRQEAAAAMVTALFTGSTQGE